MAQLGKQPGQIFERFGEYFFQHPARSLHLRREIRPSQLRLGREVLIFDIGLRRLNDLRPFLRLRAHVAGGILNAEEVRQTIGFHHRAEHSRLLHDIGAEHPRQVLKHQKRELCAVEAGETVRGKPGRIHQRDKAGRCEIQRRAIDIAEHHGRVDKSLQIDPERRLGAIGNPESER